MTSREGARRRRTVIVAGLAVVVALAVAGVALAVRGEDSDADVRREKATAILDHAAGTGDVVEASGALREQLATAEGVRIGLRMLLGRHVAVTARTIEGAVVGAPDLEADARSLRTNSQALAAGVALAYGPVGGRAFDELWSQHAQLLVAYGTARGTGDDAGADEARRALEQYHADFTSFCSLATGLPAPTVEELVGAHLTRLFDYADAVDAGDRARAAEILGRALTEITAVADALAGAIVAEHEGDIPGSVDAPEVERTAAAASSVQRTTTLLIEGDRAGITPDLGPTVEVQGGELAPAWADLVGVVAEGGEASSAELSRAALSDGIPAEQASALVTAVDVWLDALADHDEAVAAGRGEDSTAAAASAERAAIDVGAQLAAPRD